MPDPQGVRNNTHALILLEKVICEMELEEGCVCVCIVVYRGGSSIEVDQQWKTCPGICYSTRSEHQSMRNIATEYCHEPKQNVVVDFELESPSYYQVQYQKRAFEIYNVKPTVRVMS